MKKKISILLVLCTLMVCFTGCDLLEKFKKTDSKEKANNVETKEEKKDTTAKKDVVNDNASYYVKVNGKKFTAGDKIADISKVGLKQDSRVLDKKISKNTYLIGGGTIYNSNDKSVFTMTPFNATDSEITVKDAVFGAFEAGSYEYGKIDEATTALNIEVVGGIKFGSSYEDMVKVFGETDQVYEATSLGYKTYTYKSSEVYRSYEFTIDKDGKICKIHWQNLVFNR